MAELFCTSCPGAKVEADFDLDKRYAVVRRKAACRKCCNKRIKAIKLRNRAAGKCRDCGKPSGAQSLCRPCADLKNAQDKRRRESGGCRTCGKPLDRLPSGARQPRCATCLSKDRIAYRARAAAGVCLICKSNATAGLWCLTHWFKNIGQSYGLNKRNGGLDMLRQIWEEQGGRCAVTGAKLVPGGNASLDHIVPQSKGGTSEKSNLRWVTALINHMKWDATDEEFVAMCRVVVDRASRAAVVKVSKNLLERSN